MMQPGGAGSAASVGHTTWRAAWTRGHGNRPLAELLGDGPPDHLRDDLAQSCIDHQTNILVARRLTNFDLVPIAVPHHLDLHHTTALTVAVADGPHSPLAAAVASRIASRLDVPWSIVTAYPADADQPAALARLEKLSIHHPKAAKSAMETRHAASLTESLTSSTLLVLGAGGGSWLQRQLIGPGHRLMVNAPGGAVTVRSAPRRCFHALDDTPPPVVGPLMPVSETIRLFDQAAIPVADHGQLVGIVRQDNLVDASRDALVGDVMEPPVSVAATEPLSSAQELLAFLDGGPVPVTGPSGSLLGVIVGSTGVPLGPDQLEG